MNKGRVVIGEVERAGKPVTAEIYNFESEFCFNGMLRWRDMGESFVLEQFSWEPTGPRGSGIWQEVKCYVKLS